MALTLYAFRVSGFGENVKRLRKRAGLTQEELAHRLGLARPGPVSLLEGKRKGKLPKPVTIRKWAKALGVEPWELLEGVETEYDRLRIGSPSRSDLTRHDSGVDSPLSLNSAVVQRGAHAEIASSSAVEHLRTTAESLGAMAATCQQWAADLQERVTELIAIAALAEEAIARGQDAAAGGVPSRGSGVRGARHRPDTGKTRKRRAS